MNKDVKAGRRRKSGFGALFTLALLMAASGVLRLGDGIGIAMARAESGGSKTDDQAPSDALNCALPPAALAEALSDREAKVSAREQAMVERLAALTLADQVIEDRLAVLAEAEAKLSETLARADGASEADLTRLTEVYESMKPKDSSALFAAMAPEFAAGFLGRMRPESSAAILSGMPTENAYAISVLLAGRNALVPK